MSTESILTLVGIGVGVVLFLLGLVMSVLGYLLSLQMKHITNELANVRQLEMKITRLEVWVGMKKPSDQVRRIGDTSA